MFPSFGTEYSPGDLLSSKTFQKVASLDVETESDEKLKFFIQHAIIDSSKALSNLCSMLECNGQYMAKAILGAQERFESLLNFLYSQRNYFACVGSYIIRKEDENCFEINAFQNSPAGLMISKTVSGTFFLCVLTSKFPIKNIIALIQEFKCLLQKPVDISSENLQYFDDQSIEVTVFANWDEMLCDQKPVQVAFEKMLVYSKENEPKVIAFEVDDIVTNLPMSPNPMDPNFEKCYRLMRSIKLKGSELPKLNDSKKKKNDSVTYHRLKSSLEDLENELKHDYFLHFETVEQIISVFPDALNHVETNLRRWASGDVALDLSFYETFESCLTLLLTKYNGGNCDIRNNTVLYNAEDTAEVQKIFGNKAFIALKSPSFEFKTWLDFKFLQLYPLCYVRKYPSNSESLLLCDNGIEYGFGVATLKRSYRSRNAKFEHDTFSCVNPEHKHPRYWKCNACNIFVNSNGKEISCKKCGTSSFENVEFRCALSDGKICTKKAMASSRLTERVNKKVDVNNTEAKNVYNIVLFGPVASGKSTLINAVMNYCEYASYENASSRSLVAPIPYKFSFFDSSFQEQIIQSKEIPENCPENFESKSHVTQKPNVYEKYYNGKTFKFLDTIGYGSTKESAAVHTNLALWRTFKHIDAVWVTISATQDLGDNDVWIRHIIKPIPKKLFSRIYFVFTNIHGKHALRFNSNVKIVAQLVKQFDVPFGESNVFAIENSCLKSLYAQGAGGSLVGVQGSLGKSWAESRGVILDLLDKASALKSHDEDVYFLINLFFLYFRLKKPATVGQLRETGCVTLLEHNFLSSSQFISDKSPSYSDVYNALAKLESKIPIDSHHHALLVEFIKTFEDFAKKQHYGTFDMVADTCKKVLNFWR